MADWRTTLYPYFRPFIRGQVYGIMTEDDLDQECYDLAVRAIAAFKFPRISTEYITYYAVRDKETGKLIAITPDDERFGDAISYGEFVNQITQAEIDIIVAWMKVYWCEAQISNADNFEDMYTDSNIKTYSRANAVAQNLKLMAEFRTYARDLETRYSRTKNYKPTIGDIHSEDTEEDNDDNL